MQGVGGGSHLVRRQLQLLAQTLHHTATACSGVSEGSNLLTPSIVRVLCGSCNTANKARLEQRRQLRDPLASPRPHAHLQPNASAHPASQPVTPTCVQAEVVKCLAEVGDVPRHTQPTAGWGGGCGGVDGCVAQVKESKQDLANHPMAVLIAGAGSQQQQQVWQSACSSDKDTYLSTLRATQLAANISFSAGKQAGRQAQRGWKERANNQPPGS